MHCTMGKDEYDKSQGGILPPISPEHSGETQSVPQGPIAAANHVSCSTPQPDCKSSKMIVLNNGLPTEPPPPFIPRYKRPTTNGGCYRTKHPDPELPKSCPSDSFFKTLNGKPETSSQSELAPNGPEYSSDSEELGLRTHRPNVNANSHPDLATHDFKNGHRQGRKDRAASSTRRKRGDNFVNVRVEDPKKYHHTATNNNHTPTSRKGNVRQRFENNKYNPMQSSPPQTHNGFVHVQQGEYDMDDVSVAYQHQHHHPQQMRNYEQYVVPPNFAYTADDIYRNAFSVGSYPNHMAHKKMVPEMFSFVNALVSPPFFAPSYHPRQELNPCQYYTAVNQPDVPVNHRQSAQQTPRGTTPMGLPRFPSSSASPYVDGLHHPMDPLSSVGGDYSDQTPQPHLQGTNTSQVVGQESWLQNGGSNGEKVCSSSLGTVGSYGNGKPIFRSRSFSAVEQSSREAELAAVHADNFVPAMSPHHSSYSFGDMENALHNLHFSHSKPDNRYHYTNGSAPLNDYGSSCENLPPGCSWQPESNDMTSPARYSWASERRVPTQSESYEDEAGFVTDDNVFCQSGVDYNFRSSSSFPGWTVPLMNQRSAFYHDGKSQSFSHAENYLSFGGNKLESYSDTEVYSRSPQQSSSVHQFHPSNEYEDVGHQDLPSTAQAVFAMDEELFNPPDPHFQRPVPPLNLADSAEFDNRQLGCLMDRDRQERFQASQVYDEGFGRHQGTRYNCARGPRRRKSGGGATDINRSMANGHCGNLDPRPVNGVPMYRRHWDRSSTSWASYHCKDLNTFSSLACQQQQLPQPLMNGKYQGSSPSNLHWKDQRKNGQTCGGGQVKNNNNKWKNYPKKSSRPLGPSQELPASQPESESQDVSESELIKWHNGTVYPWDHLPEEIWLNIFSFLGNHDRFQCFLVSKQFQRMLKDESIWRHITMEKKMLQDDWLKRIADHHPSTLDLIQCHGDQVTAAGLTYLFNECTDSLLKLRFSRCSRGQLTGDNILLASAVCRNLTHVDASWCTVTDSGLSAIAKSCDRLESLCLNGCGLIADTGLNTLATLHCKSLKELEMFGCFNVTSRGIRHLASICKNLRILQLGQCFKLTNSCIAEVSRNLRFVENLDLRGCKQIKDTCIEKIVDHCSLLQTLALANCPNISNTAIEKIARMLPGIRSIDVCGCKLITDESINRLAMNCRELVYLDISSTGCTYESVWQLAETGSTHLETLKLNFIDGITESSLTRLTTRCTRLTTLHLYGCRQVKNLDWLQALHPNLMIEID